MLNRAEQRANPASEWLTAEAWDNITQLELLPSFTGLASSFEQSPRDWRHWYMASAPEEETLPGEWDAKCSELQHMVIVRCVGTTCGPIACEGWCCLLLVGEGGLGGEGRGGLLAARNVPRCCRPRSVCVRSL